LDDVDYLQIKGLLGGDHDILKGKNRHVGLPMAGADFWPDGFGEKNL